MSCAYIIDPQGMITDPEEQRYMQYVIFELNKVVQVDVKNLNFNYDDVEDAWADTSDIIYRDWSHEELNFEELQNADYDDGFTTLLPYDAFYNSSEYLYLDESFINDIYFQEGMRDPRRSRLVIFDGPLINYQLSWVSVFIKWHRLPQVYFKEFNDFIKLLETLNIQFEQLSYKQMMKQY